MVTMGQADRATGRGGEELRGLQGWFVSGAEHHGRHSGRFTEVSRPC